MPSAWNTHSLSNSSHPSDPGLTSRLVSVGFELSLEVMSKKGDAAAKDECVRVEIWRAK